MESSPGSRWRGKSRPRWEGMEEAPVTAATGSLGPVIAKLSALLGSEYKLRRRTRRDLSIIRAKLKPVHSILWNIWEGEELDAPSRALKMEALDLADDVEDSIDDFILSFERNLINKRLVQIKFKTSPFQDFKKRVSDVSGRCRRKWEEKKNPFSSLLSCGKLANDNSNPGKPRAYPFVRKVASELVGLVGPRDKIIQHLVGEDDEPTPVGMARQRDELKKAFIYGSAGMGKTTLADLVYGTIGSNFQSRAFVSVARPGGNMREVLTRIFQKVAPFSGAEAATGEDLIGIISNFLKDKRYLVVIDDIWNWSDWEVIMTSLPENNLGSTIVGTTCINDVARKWRKESYGPNGLLYEMVPEWHDEEGWVYKIGEENIVSLMIAMKADLVADGFDDKHSIVRRCGGTPLAVCCMLSAVAHEREKQAHQGLHSKACDVQDEIEKHVIENGIQNTPGFEPLVECFQLAYDDLPHHMLKTCLLYCSIYPNRHYFKMDDLVSRWIFEGFACKEDQLKGYCEELYNRGFIVNMHMQHVKKKKNMHMQPMMQNFLRYKSRQDYFTTCSSEITPSYKTIFRIRRLCIENSQCGSSNAVADSLAVLDWYHIRSLVVCEGIERVPLEKLECLRVLDLCGTHDQHDHHLKDICGLVRLRHLLGLNWDIISEIPLEIVRLQCLETLYASGSGNARSGQNKLNYLELPKEIGSLQKLKSLDIKTTRTRVMPKEIGKLHKLKTLDISNTPIRVLPKEIGSLQQLKALDISYTNITVLPKEIGKLQQLKALDISYTRIKVLPKEIRELQQLKDLNISSTMITVLPKEIGELQQLEHLLIQGTKLAKIPREIGAMKKLKRINLNSTILAVPLEVCYASTIVKLPDSIRQALNKSGLVSKLAGEMLSFQKSVYSKNGGLVVGAKQMHIPSWIKEHFNDIYLLDIRFCKLEEQGLKILREMPKLGELRIRFQVVPREQVVISSEGFALLRFLTVDSRVPRVTFQEEAMPTLEFLKFEFQFYAGPPNIDPMGINHLRRLYCIEFECNRDWYGGGDSPCMRPTIDIVEKEAKELRRLAIFRVCGHDEEISSLGGRDQQRAIGETEEVVAEDERSDGVGQIEGIIQA